MAVEIAGATSNLQPPPQTGFAFLGGLANTAVGIWDSIANRKQSVRNINYTINANKQMAEYQYSKDLEMWNRQNAYNSPEQQQLRIAKAGLNPNLVYGSGSVVGNTSGQMPRYNAPTLQYNYRPPQIGQSVESGLSAYLDLKMRQAQIDNVKASTARTLQTTLFEGQNVPFIQYEKYKTMNLRNDYQLLQNQLLKATQANLADLSSSQLIKSQAEVQQVKLENELRKLEIKYQSFGKGAWLPVIQMLRTILGR